MKFGEKKMNEWVASGAKNSVTYASVEEDAQIKINIGDDNPAYIFYGVEPFAFANAPTSGSIPAVGNSKVQVASNIEVPLHGSARLGAVVYSLDDSKMIQHETFWGDSQSLEFSVSHDVQFIIIVLRTKGAGNYVMKEFTTEILPLSEYSVLEDEIHQVFEFDQNQTDYITAELTVKSLTDSPSSLICVATWLDDSGNVIPGIPDRAVNPKFGPYDYLEIDNTTKLSLPTPSGASKVVLQTAIWSRKDPVYVKNDWKITAEALDIEQRGDLDSDAKLRIALANLDDDTPLIVLHTTAPPLGHSTLSLRPNRLAVEFKKLGFAVLFLPFSTVPEGIVEFDDNVWVVCRTLWPTLQLELARRQTENNIFVCTSFPNFEAISAIDFLSSAGWKTAYEIRDDMEEFNRVGYSRWFDPQLEMYVAKRVDFLMAVSPRLASKANIIAARGDAVVSPNAVSEYLITQGENSRNVEFQKGKFGSKVVGYLGHLTDSWFDWSSVLAAANRLPDFEFRIIGHGFPDRLEGNLPSNVSYLGPMTHEDFVSESQAWSVGLIPFKPSPLTFGVDPNKLYEYLALGVRVVSAPMGGVDSAPWTSVYRSVDELVAAIQVQSQVEPEQSLIDELNQYLKNCAWNVRAQQILEHLGGLN